MQDKKNNNLHSILLNSNAFQCDIDVDQRVLRFGENFSEVTGIQSYSTIKFSDFLPHLPEAEKAHFNAIYEATNTARPPEFSFRFTLYSDLSESINFQFNGCRQTQSPQTITGLCFKLQAENISDHQINYHKSLFHQYENGILIIDHDGRIKEVNQSLKHLFKIDVDEAFSDIFQFFEHFAFESTFIDKIRSVLQSLPFSQNQDSEKQLVQGPLTVFLEGSKKIFDITCNSCNVNEQYCLALNFKDITQQELVSKELQEERNLFLSGPVIVLKWNLELEKWPVSYVSPNVEQVLGYSRPEIESNNVLYQELIHPDDLPNVLLEAEENLNKKQIRSFSQQYRLKTKSGSYRHFNDFTTIERDENGNATGINGYLIDNTEYIEAQKQLKKSEIKYRDVFETAGVGIIYTDKEGIILDTNKKFDEIVGRSHGALQNQSAMRLINNNLPKATAKAMLPVLFHVLKGNRIDPMEIRVGEKAYEIQSDYNPDLSSNIGILRDITDKKKAEKALQKSEAKYRYLINNIKDGIAITNSREEVTYMNAAASKILEVSSGHLPNKSLRDLATESSAEIIDQEEAGRRAGKSSTYYIEIITPNGNWKNLEINASPLFDEHNNYNGSYGLIRDITEKVKAEMELKSAYSQLKRINLKLQEHATELERAKQKAEESDRLKSAFLANISHEIRTPMNGIVGFAQLCMHTGLTDDKRKNYLNIIAESTMQLEAVVMDIIDLSKIESGESVFSKTTIDPEEHIHKVYEEFKAKATEKGLDLNVNLRESLPKINTDAVRFRQVIKVFINNAIKFTPEGSVLLEAYTYNTSLYVAVKDTGIGIEAGNQELIFEPFRQVELSMKRQFGGTGLGLTIAKKIVNMLQGEVLVESEPGKGSRFIFRHPLS